MNQHPPERPTCATCPYWQIKHASDVEILAGGVMVDGECRRYAPSRLGTSESWSTRWCGEHPDFPAWIKATRASPAPSSDGGATASPSLGAKIVAELVRGKLSTMRLRQVARDHGVSRDQAKRVAWYELAARNPSLQLQRGKLRPAKSASCRPGFLI